MMKLKKRRKFLTKGTPTTKDNQIEEPNSKFKKKNHKVSIQFQEIERFVRYPSRDFKL